jgi:hypothetical protein
MALAGRAGMARPRAVFRPGLEIWIFKKSWVRFGNFSKILGTFRKLFFKKSRVRFGISKIPGYVSEMNFRKFLVRLAKNFHENLRYVSPEFSNGLPAEMLADFRRAFARVCQRFSPETCTHTSGAASQEIRRQTCRRSELVFLTNSVGFSYRDADTNPWQIPPEILARIRWQILAKSSRKSGGNSSRFSSGNQQEILAEIRWVFLVKSPAKRLR